MTIITEQAKKRVDEAFALLNSPLREDLEVIATAFPFLRPQVHSFLSPTGLIDFLNKENAYVDGIGRESVRDFQKKLLARSRLQKFYASRLEAASEIIPDYIRHFKTHYDQMEHVTLRISGFDFTEDVAELQRTAFPTMRLAVEFAVTEKNLMEKRLCLQPAKEAMEIPGKNVFIDESIYISVQEATIVFDCLMSKKMEWFKEVYA